MPITRAIIVIKHCRTHPTKQDISYALDNEGFLIGASHSHLQVCTQATMKQNKLFQARKQLLHLVGC